MEPKRYWWMLVKNISLINGKVWYTEQVMDIHPFHFKGGCIAGESDEWRMFRVNYKLIDVTEYNLFNELNDKK